MAGMLQKRSGDGLGASPRDIRDVAMGHFYSTRPRVVAIRYGGVPTDFFIIFIDFSLDRPLNSARNRKSQLI